MLVAMLPFVWTAVIWLSLCGMLKNGRMMIAANPDAAVVDEGLYSRQLYVMGMPAQQRLAAANVLVVGLGGVGVELAKNVILAGPRSVSLIDLSPTRYEDLSTQYYLSEESLGKSRASESYNKLKDLNPLVQLHLLEPSDGSIEAIAKAIEESKIQMDVIVAADQDLEQQEALNALARRFNARFVSAQAPGVFGSIFCDFGDDFTVNDTDGKEAKSGIIKNIEHKETETLVTLIEGEKHDLSKHDKVAFEGADGGEEVCLREESFKVCRIVTPTMFALPRSAVLSNKLKGGRFRQIKQPLQLSFKPLTEAKKEMKSLPTDFGKASAGRQLTLHACFEALACFRKQKGLLPVSGSVADAETFVKLVKSSVVIAQVKKSQSLKKTPVLDEKVIEIFSRSCRGSLAAICSFVGGTAAQEVLKAVTHTFVPLHQYLFFDAVEALPAELPDEEDCQAREDRYDGQRAVLGEELLTAVQDQRVFVVGAGAIGCELLKNMALLGVGQVTVTDNDIIEKSNLNRQFLFREKDLGSPKSEAAAHAVMDMNPEMEVTALTKKICKDTESFFNDRFWFDHDVIANALDSIDARMYVDGRCVYYRRPLLESGTEGTSGNVQVVVPYLTESYGSSADPPEASIPVCTLKSFPYIIEHCIQWARDFFDGYFRIQPERLNDLLSQLDKADDDAAARVLEELRSRNCDETSLREIEATLKDLEIWDPMPSFRRCVKWAMDRFYELYDTNIRMLLKEHPLDSKTEDGEPFWSGDRRVPKAINFDPKDPLHMDFLTSAALLKARTFNVFDSSKKAADIKETLDSVLVEILPEYKPQEYVAPPDDELDARIQREFEEVRQAIGRIVEQTGKFSTIPEIFEKDQDENGHIDFVTSASNLRALNYAIAPADRLQTKKIAGRIIPAIATTTSVVAGLASLELIKLAQKEVPKALGEYKNAFVNLAGPFFALTEPMEAPPIALGENGRVYSIWDRLDLAPRKELTMRKLLAYALKHFGLQITSVTIYASKILYADFMHTEDDPVLDQTISDLVAVEDGKTFVDLEIECADEDGEEVESPPIRYFFPKRNKSWLTRLVKRGLSRSKAYRFTTPTKW